MKELLINYLENVKSKKIKIDWDYCPGGKYTTDIVHPFEKIKAKDGYKQAFEISCSKWLEEKSEFIPHLSIIKYPIEGKRVVLKISEEEYLEFINKAKNNMY